MNFSRKRIRTSLENNKLLLSNFSYLSILEGISLIFPLLTYPYLIRTLGANLYGIIIIAQAITAYLTIIVNFGFSISATKRISENRNNTQELSKIFSSVIYIKSLLCLIVSIPFLGSIFIFNPEYKIVYILSLGIIIQGIFFPIWFFQGIEKMKYITYITLFFRSFFLLCIFIFIRSESDYYYVPLINFLGSIVVSLIAIYIVKKKFNLRFVKRSIYDLKFTFYESVPFFLSSLSTVLIVKSNLFLIGIFFNPSMVAVYDLAEKVMNVLKTPIGVIAQVLYPNISLSKDKNLLKKIYRLNITLAIVLSVFTIIFAKQIVLLLGGHEIIQAVGVLQLMTIHLPLFAASYILGPPTLVVFNHTREYNLSFIYGLLTYTVIILSLIVLNRIDCYTVVIAYILTELSIVVYRRYVSIKYKIF